KYVAIGEQTAALWGVSVAISILLAGLVSPILGAYTDKLAQRKRYFIVLSLLSIIGTMLLYTTAQMSLFYGILFFIIINTAFGLSRSLYDSFITVVPDNKNTTTFLSGFSWAMGYIGGPLCLLIVWLFLGQKLPINLSDYRILFPITGLFFLTFSLWTYYSLPQDIHRPVVQKSLNAFQTVWKSLRLWKSMKHIFVFLIAMYFIMDGITTIIYFISLYAKVNLQFSIEQIVGILLLVQIVGIFATIFIGWLAEKYGEIRLLIICSIIWLFIIILIFLSDNYTSFLIIAALTGLVIGSTPAIARGFFGKIIPAEKRAELFGFNTFASRMASLLGPLIFGIASSFWNMRIAILTIIPFFIIGVIMLVYLKINFKKWQTIYVNNGS
ncbi:MFS transporter, partial [Candidatus Pacearchaeota archaeon]|nr:MFS transporter [Candidatus Pacearchaeota archaeon]